MPWIFEKGESRLNIRPYTYTIAFQWRRILTLAFRHSLSSGINERTFTGKQNYCGERRFGVVLLKLKMVPEGLLFFVLSI